MGTLAIGLSVVEDNKMLKVQFLNSSDFKVKLEDVCWELVRIMPNSPLCMIKDSIKTNNVYIIY